jgi:hypothetical protein
MDDLDESFDLEEILNQNLILNLENESNLLNNPDFKFIIDYWKTLERKKIFNIKTSEFIKKPYLENYIIQLATFSDFNLINLKIKELINNNIIELQDIILFLKNNFEFNLDEKKKLENYFLKNNFDNFIINLFTFEIIIYQIKYFRFYQIIIELLFDNDDKNELYNFIFIYIKNKKNKINNLKQKNLKFIIFHFYLEELSLVYLKIYKLLLKYKFINNINSLNINLNIQNLFIKNLFNNWYNIYKKDILDNKFNSKIINLSNYKSIIKRILCLPNC